MDTGIVSSTPYLELPAMDVIYYRIEKNHQTHSGASFLECTVHVIYHCSKTHTVV